MNIPEHDANEVFRQEYFRRKKEEAEEARRLDLSLNKGIFKIFRFVALLLLMFSILLIIDFYLPAKIVKEAALRGWQERESGSYRPHYSSGKIVSLIQTPNFTVVVPDKLHLNYKYYEEVKKPLHIAITPLLGTVKQITIEGDSVTYPVRKTIYAFIIPLPYLLLISALFTVIRRKYSKLNYALCFLPLVIFVIILVVMIPVDFRF